MEQVEKFRDLGNRLYRVMPNPVLKGWRPCDLQNPPVLPDALPDSEEDIPDNRPLMDELRETIHDVLEAGVKPGKIGRNDPCPCGSGKKYKKCHGRNV